MYNKAFFIIFIASLTSCLKPLEGPLVSEILPSSTSGATTGGKSSCTNCLKLATNHASANLASANFSFQGSISYGIANTNLTSVSNNLNLIIDNKNNKNNENKDLSLSSYSYKIQVGGE